MMQVDMVSLLSEAIEAARQRNSFTLGQLARELGFSRQDSLTAWKNGATESYDFAKVLRLFELAGMSIDEAFGLAAPREPGVVEFDVDTVTQIQELRGILKQQSNEINAIREGIYLLVNRQSDRQFESREDVRRDAERVIQLLSSIDARQINKPRKGSN